jgi:F0F1-type ATP synthase membrane subunit a
MIGFSMVYLAITISLILGSMVIIAIVESGNKKQGWNKKFKQYNDSTSPRLIFLPFTAIISS